MHGGFWREEYDRTHVAPLAEALARDGFHVANLEYPRIGMPGGGWPGTGASVARPPRGGAPDTHLPDRVVVVGHSAGGHLALWLASEDHAPWLTGVVALAPAADLARGRPARPEQRRRPGPARRHPREAPEAWADADPARQRLTRPAVIVTGELDDVVPAERRRLLRRVPRPPASRCTTAVAQAAPTTSTSSTRTTDAYLLLLAEVEELTLTTH